MSKTHPVARSTKARITHSGQQRISFTMDGVSHGFRPVLFSAFALMLATGASAEQKTASKQSLPDCGPLVGQILRCPRVGFTYKVPFGWVDRTEEMQQSGSSAASKAPKDADEASHEETGRTLLAAFERPPGTPGGFNSAVIIAVEDSAAYPQVKTAADYFGPLSEIAAQRGFKMDGDPYSFSIGTGQVVRGDFTGGDEKNPIRQTSLVLLKNGYILSSTFLASSDDEIDSLMENLTFSSSTRKTSPK